MTEEEPFVTKPLIENLVEMFQSPDKDSARLAFGILDTILENKEDIKQTNKFLSEYMFDNKYNSNFLDKDNTPKSYESVPNKYALFLLYTAIEVTAKEDTLFLLQSVIKSEANKIK